VSFREGEPIIYKGDKVSKAQIEALQALNIYGVKTDFYKFFGIVLLTTILLVLIERFLCYFFSQYHNQTKYYFLLYTVILLTLLIEEGLRHFNGYYSAIDIRFMTPIPMASMLLSFLVAPGLALLCGTVICVLTAISFNMDFSLFVFLFISNCATAFLTYRKYSRSELIWAGYFVGIINLILVVTLGCVRDIYAWTWFVPNMGVAMLNGVVSSMLSLAILPYFESMFQMTTRQTLLELSNLNHPLLKRLMLSAPGTYQHSIMVANLAEAAAETVLADPVLTRVGAYFHDIGKIKRPGFFTENQTGENPHTGLAPRMSKLIIVSHVKDGLELAQKYKLPLPVQQIIAEHHGTSMVSFFYSQVIQTENIKDPDAIKDDFRYPGPKPHFKECGIVMLADSVEAASRSLEKPTYSKIEALVEKVFRDKISDGQMDECPLTLREIEKIKSTFLKVFKGIYHSRLDYEEELESIIKNANKES
jgi:putative nucleotidyltransferase with HDIG domain